MSRAAKAAGIAVAIALGALALVPDSFVLRPNADDPAAAPMRAIRYRAAGPPAVLALDPATPRPRLRPGQVLVAVAHAALNPCDFKFRRNPVPGFLLPMPKIPGADIAGVVVDAGTSKRFQVGRVCRARRRLGHLLLRNCYCSCSCDSLDFESLPGMHRNPLPPAPNAPFRHARCVRCVVRALLRRWATG